MAKTDKSGNVVNLYWVTTDDHDEDWFILARTGRTAASYHIQHEGYESGDGRNSSCAQQWIRSQAPYHGTRS
jgi:uncharacterized protein YllA (UPF0747 family)